MNDFSIGSNFGNYKIERLIGKGAMAEVFQAYHPNLDRHVAIKRLHNFLAEQTDMLDRFQREAQNIAGMMHPNIVQVYDFDKIDSTYYMVMEFIDGDPLKDVLRTVAGNGQSLPLSEAVRIAKDVGEALAYAHRRNIVHRDVKPANIMLEKTGRTVLTDFGLARVMTGPQHTTTGTIVGTPSYMSPEQGSGGQGDARSDIYALGALLYEMLCGQPPYSGETPIAVIYKHVNAPVPSVRDVNAMVPNSLDQVVARAMQKAPENRYSRAEEIVADLGIIYETSISGEMAQPGTAKPQVVGRPIGLRINLLENDTTYELVGKDRYIFGRLDGAFKPDVDFGVNEGAESGVSRLHAEIEINADGAVLISDLESTNGTWVNGKRVPPNEAFQIYHGDLVRIGRSTIQIIFLR